MNKNAIPNDPEKPFVTSGIRLGTAAMTTRGFKEEETRQLGNLIADVLDNPENEAVIAEVAAKVKALCDKLPVYGWFLRLKTFQAAWNLFQAAWKIFLIK